MDIGVSIFRTKIFRICPSPIFKIYIPIDSSSFIDYIRKKRKKIRLHDFVVNEAYSGSAQCFLGLEFWGGVIAL